MYVFTRRHNAVASETLTVTDYRGHRQTLLPVDFKSYFSPGPDLAGAYSLWSSNLVVTEFCLSKIALFYLFSLYGICFAQFYIDVVVFVVWKYSDCFNVLY